MLHPKKVGTLPIEGREEEKQTNEIKTAAPLLSVLDIKGRTITADALLTQRELARHLVEDHQVHYHFTAKGNQKNLLAIALHFQDLKTEAEFIQTGRGEHGRIETRKISTTTKLNHYLDFPYVAQVFRIEQASIDKKTREQSHEIVYGITRRPREQASPECILNDNRGHWCIESIHYIIDWNYAAKIVAKSGKGMGRRISRDCAGLPLVC